MDNAPIIEVAAGLDVSKDTLDLAIVPDGLVRVFSNDSAGHAKLVQLLKKVDLIVIEASGGFERVIVAELVAADLPVVLVNPRQVRNFARDGSAGQNRSDRCAGAGPVWTRRQAITPPNSRPTGPGTSGKNRSASADCPHDHRRKESAPPGP